MHIHIPCTCGHNHIQACVVTCMYTSQACVITCTYTCPCTCDHMPMPCDHTCPCTCDHMPMPCDHTCPCMCDHMPMHVRSHAHACVITCNLKLISSVNQMLCGHFLLYLTFSVYVSCLFARLPISLLMSGIVCQKNSSN